MASRQSRATRQASAWVNRSPSGLPLCPICHKELGFCSHSSISRGSARDMMPNTKEESTTAPISPAGNGAAVPAPSTVPITLGVDAPGQPRESTALDDRLQHGTKRRRSSVLQGALRSVKRRGTLDHHEGDSSASIASNENHSTTVPLNREHSTSTAEETTNRGAENRVRVADGCADGAVGDKNGDAVDEETLLLRFSGFEANRSNKECISCYNVANITVNFVCEERREKETKARKAQDAAEGQRQSDHESSRAGAEPVDSVMAGIAADVPHVMCVDCFRVFVDSRVSECKLVTSKAFDGYTVGCPMGCADSFIDPSCFEEVMGANFMVKYRRFSALHHACRLRIVWCPACHCGVIPSTADALAGSARSSVVSPALEIEQQQQPRARSRSSLWGRWGGAGAEGSDKGKGGREQQQEVQEEEGERSLASFCVGCPGCQASLCMACRELHAPGVSCVAAAAAAAAASAAGDENEGGGGDGRGADGSGAARRESRGLLNKGDQEASPTKRCPNCHVPIFKDGGCNHMKCSRCQFEFCWLHLTKWIVGGECQRGHWSSNRALNRVYNARRVARNRDNCTIS